MTSPINKSLMYVFLYEAPMHFKISWNTNSIQNFVKHQLYSKKLWETPIQLKVLWRTKSIQNCVYVTTDEEAKQTIIDNTETNLVSLRRTCSIYLTIQSSLDFEECAHKILKMELKPGQEVTFGDQVPSFHSPYPAFIFSGIFGAQINPQTPQ